MTNTSKTIIFFGTEDFSLTILSALIAGGYSIAAIVTKPDSKSGRGQKLTAPLVKTFALDHHIPVWQPQKVSEINESLASLRGAIGILASYGKIIPPSTLNLFPFGIVNVHPSLLPRYRGPSPIESSIKNGDSTTGVSIMRLVPEMDAGPIYSQVTYPLTGHETRPELYDTLAKVGADILIKTLPAILDETLVPVAQNEQEVTFCPLITKQDAFLDPAAITAQEAERQVRAHLGFPKTKLSILGYDIIITKSHVVRESKTPLDIMCQDGAFLSIDELIAPSGRRMSAQAFLNGYTVG